MPIPVSEVYAYCLMFGIDDLDDRAEFLSVIRRLDDFFLQEKAKQK